MSKMSEKLYIQSIEAGGHAIVGVTAEVADEWEQTHTPYLLVDKNSITINKKRLKTVRKLCINLPNDRQRTIYGEDMILKYLRGE